MNGKVPKNFNLPGHRTSDMQISILEKVHTKSRAVRETRESLYIKEFQTELRGMNEKKWKQFHAYLYSILVNFSNTLSCSSLFLFLGKVPKTLRGARQLYLPSGTFLLVFIYSFYNVMFYVLWYVLLRIYLSSVTLLLPPGEQGDP